MDIFDKFIKLFYDLSGIQINDNKKFFLKSKIDKFLSKNTQIKDYKELYDILINDKNNKITKKFISSLTVNFTYFFRDTAHFNFLKFYFKNKIKENDCLRIWSAGCSTGEEPYSIAMIIHECLFDYQKYDIKILATDLSESALDIAIKGIYRQDKIISYFDKNKMKLFFDYDKKNNEYQIKEFLKKTITFRQLSLMASSYPFHKKFDIIFLRNVLIYFNDNEKEIVLNKIYDVMNDKGYLISGLSESFINIHHKLKYLNYSIYQKNI